MTRVTGAKVFLFESSPISAKFPYLQPTQKPGVKDRPELIKSTSSMFKTYANELCHYYVSIDQFVISNHQTFKNIGTLSDLSRYTNGRFYYYPKFSAYHHSIKLDSELYTALTTKSAWEAVGRVRVSGGFRQISTLGNYLIKARTADLLSLPVWDEFRSVYYELERVEVSGDAAKKKKQPANEEDTHIFVQTALLYTSSEGERRIRVHNWAMPFTNSTTEPYEHWDINALWPFFMKKGIDNLESLNPNFLTTRSYLEMLFSSMISSVWRQYRNNAPESLDFLGWYCMGILKNEIFYPSQNVSANIYVSKLLF